MCISHHDARDPRLGAEGLQRRELLTRLAALGLTVPLATLGHVNVAAAGSLSFLDQAEFIDSLKALILKAKSPELKESRVIDLVGSELPWKDLGITLAKDNK